MTAIKRKTPKRPPSESLRNMRSARRCEISTPAFSRCIELDNRVLGMRRILNSQLVQQLLFRNNVAHALRIDSCRNRRPSLVSAKTRLLWSTQAKDSKTTRQTDTLRP